MKLIELEKDLPLFKKIKPIPRRFDDIKDKIVFSPAESDYRILNFQDLHAPYIQGELLQEAIELELKKTHLPPITYIIVGADLNQFDEFSFFLRWRKSELLEAITQSKKVLELLSKHWRIFVLTGNHDLRPEKYLRRLLPIDLVDDIMAVGSFLEWSINGLSNITRIPFHVFKMDDATFCHFEKASVIHGRTSTWAADHVMSLERYKELEGQPSRCVIQGHNHRVTGGIMYKGIWTIETGCLCPNLDYTLLQTNAHSRYEMFQHGYATISIVNHQVDVTESRGVCLDKF